MSIPLLPLFPSLDPRQCKAHLASWNGRDEPLDVFVRDRSEWDQWNAWRSVRDEFNRPYIFALIDFYLEPGVWLFGGIYEVLARSNADHSHSYTVERRREYEELEGRLKVRFVRPGRSRSVTFEKYLPTMSVAELLPEPWAGDRFPGYEGISLDFPALETVVRTNRPDWKAALENVKGVYLIADKETGKKYVGSAYGEQGVWARWAVYVGTGHGWNDELTRLIEREGLEYARRNFRVSLLEYRPARTDDRVLIDREGYWKRALLSREPHGYNLN